MTVARTRRYAIDTNLFIRGFRSEADRDALDAFLRVYGPFCHLPAIVAQELLAGVRSPADSRAVERHLIERFARRDRVLAPSAAGWIESGRVLQALVRDEGLDLPRVSKAFGNDVLLAVTCREHGVCLVTENVRDFERIRRVFDFEFTPAWPRQP